jgi:hypothetical protein
MAAAKAAYLGAVCPGNATIDRLNALIGGKSSSAISRNRAKINATAKTHVARLRAQYLALSQPKTPWPATLAKDITVIADSDLTAIDFSQRLADARSGSAVIRVWNATPADSPATRKAVQRVRLLTGLPPSGSGKSGCP